MTYRVPGKNLSGTTFSVSVDDLPGTPMVSRVSTVAASKHDPLPKVEFAFHLIAGLQSLDDISVSLTGLVYLGQETRRISGGVDLGKNSSASAVAYAGTILATEEITSMTVTIRLSE